MQGKGQMLVLALGLRALSSGSRAQSDRCPRYLLASSIRCAVVVIALLSSGCAAPSLHSAVLKHDVDAVNAMLNEGVDANSRAFYTERTALMLAARAGDATIVRILLDKGADVNARDLWANTPLLYAPAGGNVVVVQALLEKGADVNVRNVAGRTPLVLATWLGRTAIIQLLRNAGAKE